MEKRLSEKYFSKETMRMAREWAFKIIYQTDLGQSDVCQALENTLGEEALDADTIQLCRELVLGVTAHKKEIDTIVEAHTVGWSLHSMMSVNRNLLRLAVYEMQFSTHISPKGAINEAVELAKVYGEEESAKFINSILDKILKSKNDMPQGQ